MDAETRRAVREWRALVNRREYFAAHEALEGAWLRAAEPEKTFLKGLIHLAVALLHYQRGNGHGARVKYASAIRYLAALPADSGVDVPDLVAQMDRFFADLLALPPKSQPPEPRHPWPVARDGEKER
jgi:predicted metal-dependent hydrolase